MAGTVQARGSSPITPPKVPAKIRTLTTHRHCFELWPKCLSTLPWQGMGYRNGSSKMLPTITAPVGKKVHATCILRKLALAKMLCQMYIKCCIV